MTKRRLSIVGRDPAATDTAATESTPQPQPAATVPVRIVFQPNVDGTPLQPLIINGAIAIPDEGQTAVVEISLDARLMCRSIGDQIAAYDARRNQDAGRIAVAAPAVTPADLVVPSHVKRRH